ncbi:hypothetical protein VTN00DRAFT_6628 [Thermoascus crustaceus]|uniref:uncharacterized protein n=1 Tax=Thermoascus crustaceus TaxID=5088 RepID=UPI0037420A4E
MATDTTNSPLSPGMHSFTSPESGLTLSYTVHGDEDEDPDPDPAKKKPPLIIQCPGWGMGPSYLETGLAPLATHFTLVFPHPRGTNGSSRPSSAHEMGTMTHMSSDLESLRQHLHLDNFPTLLGHSNGGAIALGYAERFPDRVEKLVLLDHQLLGMRDRRALASPQTKEDPRYRDAAAHLCRMDPKTDEEFTSDVKAILPLYFFDPGRYVPELVSAIPEDRVMSLWCRDAQAKSDRETAESTDPPRMVAGLGAVKAKTLMIFGKQDMITGLGIAERTREGIPGAELLVYDRCGHFPWIEQRERTLGDIAGFLSRA